MNGTKLFTLMPTHPSQYATLVQLEKLRALVNSLTPVYPTWRFSRRYIYMIDGNSSLIPMLSILFWSKMRSIFAGANVLTQLLVSGEGSVRDQAITSLLAGHDTTTHGMTWLIHCLLWNPQQMEETREGLASKCERGEFVQLSPWVTHRDSEFWKNPERFDPSRFYQIKMIYRASYFFRLVPERGSVWGNTLRGRKCKSWSRNCSSNATSSHVIAGPLE